MRTLRFGDWGDDVKMLQNLLKQKGYNVSVTGIFDTQTAQAVQGFQGANKDNQGVPLAVDAIVGPKTWGTLTRGTVITPPPQPGTPPDAAQSEENRIVFLGLALAGIALFFLWN